MAGDELHWGEELHYLTSSNRNLVLSQKVCILTTCYFWMEFNNLGITFYGF